MKHIKFLMLLLIIFTSLQAEYIRSIRLGTFPDQVSAQKALNDLNNFVTENQEIIRLQEEHQFIFKYRASGEKYYITLVEPFIKREVLQKVLDILRTEYPSAYVASLKSLPKEYLLMKKKESVPVAVKEVPANEQTVVIQQETPVKVEVKQVEKIVAKDKTIVNQTKQASTLINETKTIEKTDDNNIWQILFWSILLIFLALSYLWYKGRQKIENHLDKEVIYEGKITQLSEELKRKDRLVSHVSHELRTPMTAIMGLSHLVLESELSKLQKDNIQRIEDSAKHLLSLINDILDASKIEAGKLKLEKTEFNINDIIEYVINIISVQAKDNNIKLSLNIDHNVPSRVIGDSLRVGQILINILGNAVKFTKDGDISLKIKKISSFSDGIGLEFMISDTGIGMTEEQVSKIFDSYSQAEGSTSREYGGTGLGLSITKQLIEMMHGNIKVNSKKGMGSTFVFTLQFKVKDPQNKRQYRLPSASFLNKRVLIVDSSKNNILALTQSLGYFKYQVHAVPSFEGIVLDPNIKFDILIINEDGLNDFAIEKIKEIKSRDNSKFVVLSELHKKLHFQVPKNLNIDGHIRTPFTQQGILNLIIELYVLKNQKKNVKKISPKVKLKEMNGKKILVAEDNDVNHKVISGLLSQTGIELTFVEDGQAAVDMIEKGNRFDMVLMDINMPVMNGYEAAKEIRKHHKNDELPIIALSADVMDEAIKKALGAGMQGHIAKPIIVDLFYKRVYETLNSSKIDIKIDETKVRASSNNIQEEELSITTGLNRCNNDAEFYKSILVEFKKMYNHSGETFMDLCDQSKFSEARRLAMDIKDVTLNIGAYNLCEDVATLEYEFEKGSRGNYKDLIRSYNEGLERLFENIDRYLEKK